MSALVIAGNSVRRLLRERTNLFFVFVLPLLLLVALGLSVAGAAPLIGIHVVGDRDPATDALIDELEGLDGAKATVYDDLGEATRRLRSEELHGLVVIPADFGSSLAAGETATVEYLVLPEGLGFEVQSLVGAAVADQNRDLRAGWLIEAQLGLTPDEAADRIELVADSAPEVTVTVVDSTGRPFAASNAVGLVAAQQVILFTFLISMTAAAALIQVRRLGVTRRMLATPTSTIEVVIGHALGRYAIAVIQAGFIVVASALLFGVDWGSWLATTAIVLSFSLVATAAALFLGALVANESQSTAIGISLGLALAALGGCMVPLEVFPDGVRVAAHVTPHAWGVDAFTEILQRGGGVGDVATELAVLVAYGGGLLAAGAVVLRRSIIG